MTSRTDKERSREWYQKNKDRKIKHSAEYKRLHPESSQKTYRKLKYEVLEHYCKGTPSCIFCGETNLDMLSLDHINNDGESHRKQEHIVGGTQTYYWVKRNGYPPIFQVLCMNCNIAKGNKLFIPKASLNELLTEISKLIEDRIKLYKGLGPDVSFINLFDEIEGKFKAVLS